MNHELNELIGNANIVRFIKSRRIAWLGHVMRMDEKRIPTHICIYYVLSDELHGYMV